MFNKLNDVLGVVFRSSLAAMLIISANNCDGSVAVNSPALSVYQRTGNISVITYNVAGLPEIISSGNPAQNTSSIGALLNDFNIAHVQEDFNYHADLYKTALHPYRSSTSGGVPFGDGLNTMSDHPFTDFTRVKWDQCNGTDCLTPKGFTFARHRLTAGVYVDFYNLHPNAGIEKADTKARRANILQLAQFIDLWSRGNAVIIMGDTNTRYTRSEDNIRELTEVRNFSDVWIELIRKGDVPEMNDVSLKSCSDTSGKSCEIVDKVFYRSNRYINLTPQNYLVASEKFVTDTGEDLSDHRPVTVDFQYSLTEDISLSDQFGGPHGTPFSDLDDIPSEPVVKKIKMRAGSRIDQVAIEFTYSTRLSHGGTGGTEKELTLNIGEYVNKIELCAGKKNGRTRIFYMKYTTNFNRTLSGGSITNDTITYTAPSNWQIVGFHGRSGSEVDKLGVIYMPWPIP